VRERTISLISVEIGPWRDLIEGADVVSEGSTREEAGGIVYYGSTSLLIAPRSRGGPLPDRRVEQVAALLRHDPHVRVLAVRVAHREASARAASLGPIRAELVVATSPCGLELSVDVVAHVLRARVKSDAR
jgi:hypothetical protein